MSPRPLSSGSRGYAKNNDELSQPVQDIRRYTRRLRRKVGMMILQSRKPSAYGDQVVSSGSWDTCGSELLEMEKYIKVAEIMSRDLAGCQNVIKKSRRLLSSFVTVPSRPHPMHPGIHVDLLSTRLSASHCASNGHLETQSPTALTATSLANSRARRSWGVSSGGIGGKKRLKERLKVNGGMKVGVPPKAKRIPHPMLPPTATSSLDGIMGILTERESSLAQCRKLRFRGVKTTGLLSAEDDHPGLKDVVKARRGKRNEAGGGKETPMTAEMSTHSRSRLEILTKEMKAAGMRGGVAVMKLRLSSDIPKNLVSWNTQAANGREAARKKGQRRMGLMPHTVSSSLLHKEAGFHQKTEMMVKACKHVRNSQRALLGNSDSVIRYAESIDQYLKREIGHENDASALAGPIKYFREKSSEFSTEMKACIHRVSASLMVQSGNNSSTKEEAEEKFGWTVQVAWSLESYLARMTPPGRLTHPQIARLAAMRNTITQKFLEPHSLNSKKSFRKFVFDNSSLPYHITCLQMIKRCEDLSRRS